MLDSSRSFGQFTPSDLDNVNLRPCPESIMYNLPIHPTKTIDELRYELLCADIIVSKQIIGNRKNPMTKKENNNGMFNVLTKIINAETTKINITNLINNSYIGFGNVWKDDKLEYSTYGQDDQSDDDTQQPEVTYYSDSGDEFVTV